MASKKTPANVFSGLQDQPTATTATIHELPAGNDNLVKFREGALAQIKALTHQVSLTPQATREAWLQIGSLLKQARDSFPDTKSFGAWIVEAKVPLLPGLDTAPKRSDAIWCAEYADRASVVPLSVDHPRKIRNWYRRAVATRVANEVQVILGEVAEGHDVVPPDCESSAEAMTFDLLLPVEEGMDLLLAEAKRWTSGTAGKTAWENAIAKFRAAAQGAVEAGVEKETILPSLGSQWGGFFSWSPKATGETVATADADVLAKALVKKAGGSMAAIQIVTKLG